MIIPVPTLVPTPPAGEYLRNKGVDGIIRDYLLPNPKKFSLRADIRFEKKQRRIASLSRFGKDIAMEIIIKYLSPSAKCPECKLGMWRSEPFITITKKMKRLGQYCNSVTRCEECNEKLHNHGYMRCPCDNCDYSDHDSDVCDCPFCVEDRNDL